jgi:hypothetical protein
VLFCQLQLQLLDVGFLENVGNLAADLAARLDERICDWQPHPDGYATLDCYAHFKYF